MKIKIEMDENLTEDEVVIRCASITDEVMKVQQAISEVVNASQKFAFYKGTTEYYLALDEILVFETDESGISAIRKKTCTRQNISCMSWKTFCRAFS